LFVQVESPNFACFPPFPSAAYQPIAPKAAGMSRYEIQSLQTHLLPICGAPLRSLLGSPGRG
jgi:hypothetical protein